MTPKDPFLEGTFWDKFWRPIRSRALLFTPDFPIRKQKSASVMSVEHGIPKKIWGKEFQEVSESWWTFRIFLIFFSLGRGKGESEAPEGGGGRFLLKIPGGGSSGGRGAEGPGGCLRRIGELGGGRANFFFFGAEMSTKNKIRGLQPPHLRRLNVRL